MADFDWGKYEQAEEVAAAPSIQPKPFVTPYGNQVQGGFIGLPSMNDIKQGFGKVGGVAANIGRDIANIPSNLTGGYIAPAVDPNFDYYKALGTQGGMDTDIAKGLIEYSPFGAGANAVVKGSQLLSKAPNLAANALGMGAYGAAENKDDRLMGAGIGAASGIAGTVGGKAIDAAIAKPIASYISRESVKPLAKKAVKLMSDLDPQAEAKAFQNAYKTQTGIEDSAWSAVDSQAKNLDKIRPGVFDNSPYKQHIQAFEEKVNAMEPAKKLDYLTALKFMNAPDVGAKAIAPQSVEGAVANRKGLNKALQSFVKENNLSSDAQVKSLIKNLKTTNKEAVNKSIPGDKSEDFQRAWEAANKETQNTQKFYGVNPNKSFKKLKEQLTSGQDIDAEVFKFFQPKSGQTATAGFDRLSTLIGEPKAQKALKSYIMKDITKGNALKAVDNYTKLSPAQRDAIFKGSREGKLLENASKIYREIGKDPHKWWNAMHMLGGVTAPGLIAGGTAKLSGEDWDKSALIGLGVSGLGISGGKGAAMLTPTFRGLANTMGRVAEKGRKNSGKNIGLGINAYAQGIGSSGNNGKN